MEGARNWVIGYLEVKNGDNVLVWTDSAVLDSDPHLPEAYAAAAREAGANVNIIVTDPTVVHPRVGQYGWPETRLPPVLREAIYACDVLVPVIEGFFHWGDKDLNIALVEYGVRFVTPPRHSRILASKYARFPAALSDAIRNKQYETIIHAKEIHVTTPSGTDLRAGVDTRGANLQRARGPGSLVQMGGSVGLLHYMNDANGVCVFDAPPFEDGREPLRWTVKNQRLVKVEGGGEVAKVITAMIAKDPNMNLLDNLLWSTTPGPTIKESVQYNMVVYRGGTVWAGMGSNRGQAWGDASRAAYQHGPHAYWWRATVFVDDVCMVQDGYVTAWNDPKIREMAKQFGDPDDLLPKPGEYPK